MDPMDLSLSCFFVFLFFLLLLLQPDCWKPDTQEAEVQTDDDETYENMENGKVETAGLKRLLRFVVGCCWHVDSLGIACLKA